MRPFKPSTRTPSRPGGSLHILLEGSPRVLTISNSLRVGRDASCDLQLDDDRISPRHAEIYPLGNLWWVRDLGSEDGTYLDEECIEAAPFIERSILQLGEGGPRAAA